VTIDDVTPLPAIVDSLGAFAVRPTARIVFDEGQPATYYQDAASAIHRVSDVMGEILDSQFVARISVDDYARRTREYLDRLGPQVDIWEIGNEANGEWVGDPAETGRKVTAAYREARARGAAAALTLHYNEGCGVTAEHDMFTWAETRLPSTLRDGLDYVFVSYYEDDCHGRRPDWPAVFRRLAQLFPHSALGFGECGTLRHAEKENYLLRYYGIELDEPRFVGGFFWWYFNRDMVPRTRTLWKVVNRMMAGP